MPKQTRFDDDVEIYRGLPDAQKIAIGEAFHILINAVLTALRSPQPPAPPPSPGSHSPDSRRIGP